jgi:glycosyltransferase involved in cell wall biosynthesis
MSFSPKVEVLMSTFNGEKYIRPQLESILKQLPEHGRVVIRDDGSNDQTIQRIKEFNDDRIHLIQGQNLGFGASFLTLIRNVDPESDLIMLSDQDDVWFADKIERAWSSLAPLNHQAALYCSAQTLTDYQLKPLNDTPPWRRPPAFENAIVENIVTGCTAAFNQKSLKLLLMHADISCIYFHDWWLYLVVSAFGQVIYDSTPTLFYRQHGANVIGHGAGYIGRQLQMVRFLMKHDWANILAMQLQAFNLSYRHLLNERQQQLIDKNFSITKLQVHVRSRLIFGQSLWRQKKSHEIPLRILLIQYQIKASLRAAQARLKILFYR